MIFQGLSWIHNKLLWLKFKVWFCRSKWPEDGNEDGSQDKDKKIEGHAKFEVVGKAVTTWAVYQEVGLIADGCGKTGAGPKTNRDDKGLRINAYRKGGGYGNGNEQDSGGIVAQDLGAYAGEQDDAGQNNLWICPTKEP